MSFPGRTPPTEVEAAHILALRVVEFLSRESDHLQVFLGSTGLSADDLRGRLQDPEVLAAAMDFLMLEDRWVLAFAADAGIDPRVIPDLRRHLPGGGSPHWT